jgi:hypothetical protein
MDKCSGSSSPVAERDVLRKMVLMRRGASAVGAGGVPGDARFSVLRLGDAVK